MARRQARHDWRNRTARLSKRRQWHNQWYEGDSKDETREKWNYNHVAYMDAFDLDDEDTADPLHQGMMLFRRAVLMSTPRPEGRLKYFNFADTVIASLVDCLSADEPHFGPEIDYVFISIDFEGGRMQTIEEAGWALLDLRDLFKQPRPLGDIIKGRNYTTTNQRLRRKFLFGETIKLSRKDLLKTITDAFDIDDDQHPGEKRKIIFVGQSPHAEIGTMKKMGIGLDELPMVKGISNTNSDCERLIGRAGKLYELLDLLNVPFERGALHCAGNDARYTLQLLIATIAEKLRPRATSAASQNALERLHRLATDKVDLRPPYDPQKKIQLQQSQRLPLQHKRLQAKQEDWFDQLDGELALSMEECELGDEVEEDL